MQELSLESNSFSIFSKNYWIEAAKQRKNTKMLVIAALITALRVIVKLPIFRIQIAEGLSVTLDAYVNSLGSVIYGPVIALMVGAVSDILGLLVTGQMGQYFPPFTLVEMSSSFIFALFFWRQRINFKKILAAKFTVNFVCNIILTSLFNKWMYFLYYGVERAEAYNLINGVRIAKNLVLFPIEASLIAIVLTAALPVVARLGIADKKYCTVERPARANFVLQIAIFTALSIGLVLLYVFFLKDIIAGLNIKLW